MTFKLWSELNPKVKEKLKPDLGLRKWDSLTEDEKDKMWKYLVFYFFDIDIKRTYTGGYNYKFYGTPEEQNQKKKWIFLTIYFLNENYKTKSYAKNFLKYKTYDAAFYDFYNIFMKEEGDVVIELLSLYSQLLAPKEEDSQIINKKEAEEEFRKRWKNFDKFAQRLNEVLADFGVNLYLTRQSFMPRQEERIIKEIYEPALSFLSHPKWKEVNKILSDSFDEYIKNTPQGYSNCVTNTVSAVQAFLQIIVNSKTGKGEIAELIRNGQKRNLIPNDFFSQKIFNNIESIFAQQRKETGIAHPKKGYATEKNARTALNLAMIFFQHCVQN